MRREQLFLIFIFQADAQIAVLEVFHFQFAVDQQLAATFPVVGVAAAVVGILRVFLFIMFAAGKDFPLDLNTAFAIGVPNGADTVGFIGVKTITAIINIPTAVTAQGVVAYTTKQHIIAGITVQMIIAGSAF